MLTKTTAVMQGRMAQLVFAKSWCLVKKALLFWAVAASLLTPSLSLAKGLESVEMQGIQAASSNDTFEDTIRGLENIRLDADQRSREFTLEEALTFALQNNPAINATYKSVQSKQWSAISDKRLWWPTIMGAGPYGDMTTIPTYPSLGQRFTSRTGKTRGSGMNMLASTPQLGPYGTVNNPIDSNSFAVVDSFNPALIARWTFFDLARGQKINASTEAAKAEELLFNMTVRNTVLDLHMKYYDLFAKRNLLRSLEDDYRINLEQLKTLQAKKGSSSLHDKNAIAQTKATLYLQLDELIEAYLSFIKSAASAAKVMGLPIGQLMQPSDNFKMSPMEPWSMNLEETIEHALNHREEIRLAQTIAKSQNHLATSLMYSYLPKMSIFGYGSYSSENGILDFSMGTEKDYGAYRSGWEGNIGLMFSWMFDGTLAAQSNSLRYAAKQQQQKAKDTKNLVAEQISTTYAEYLTAKLSLNTARQAYINAVGARTTTQQIASSTATDYSNAAQGVSSAAQKYSGAIFKYNAALSMLYRFSAIWPAGVSEELDSVVKLLKAE